MNADTYTLCILHPRIVNALLWAIIRKNGGVVTISKADLDLVDDVPEALLVHIKVSEINETVTLTAREIIKCVNHH